MMSEPTQEELILAAKELMRQFYRMLESGVLDSESRQAREILGLMVKSRNGFITGQEFNAAIDRISEGIAAMALQGDDPVALTKLDPVKEAAAKKLPRAGEFLAIDAAGRARAGLSKEAWISEVLKGHTADDEAQLGCLNLIVTLWRDGPWPWPRV
jgi:hypothetical protein